MPRIIPAFTQFFDDNGDPLVNGLLQFYETGTNNTPKNTYADVNEEIPNPNPVPLDGAGRCPNIFGTGAYNVVSFTSSMVQIQQFDPVSSNLGTTAFSDWNAATVYQFGDIVVGPDNEYYRSLINNNQGNVPATSAAQWEKFFLLGEWNANITYALNDNVILDGIFYRSLVDNNLNNNPKTTTGFWQLTAGGQFLGDAAVKAIAYNAQTIAENITVTATQNGYSAGPITINTGFTVTVETGGRWVVF